jgi:hypothetical protein
MDEYLLQNCWSDKARPDYIVQDVQTVQAVQIFGQERHWSVAWMKRRVVQKSPGCARFHRNPRSLYGQNFDSVIPAKAGIQCFAAFGCQPG